MLTAKTYACTMILTLKYKNQWSRKKQGVSTVITDIVFSKASFANGGYASKGNLLT